MNNKGIENVKVGDEVFFDDGSGSDYRIYRKKVERVTATQIKVEGRRFFRVPPKTKHNYSSEWKIGREIGEHNSPAAIYPITPENQGEYAEMRNEADLRKARRLIRESIGRAIGPYPSWELVHHIVALLPDLLPLSDGLQELLDKHPVNTVDSHAGSEVTDPDKAQVVGSPLDKVEFAEEDEDACGD